MKRSVSIFVGATAVILAIFFVWFEQRPVTPKAATWNDVLAEAGAGGYQIITTDKLSERYQDAPEALLLVDTRQEWEYRTGHLKGALNFPMEPGWWSRWRKGGDLEAFLGSDKERLLVFY